MKKLLMDAITATDATKVEFQLTKDDFIGVPILRSSGLGAGDVVTLWHQVGGAWNDTGLVLNNTTAYISLPSLGTYATSIVVSTTITDAVFTADIAGGILSNLLVPTVGANYVDGTGFTFTPTGGNNDALVTFDIVSGSVANQVLTVAGTGYVNGTTVTLLGSPAAPGMSVEVEASGLI